MESENEKVIQMRYFCFLEVYVVGKKEMDVKILCPKRL